MKGQYINLFLEGLINVLTQLGVQRIERGAVMAKRRMTADKELTSVVGIVGQVRGNFALCFSRHTAFKLVSSMMGGMPVTEFDEITRSALSEFTNMAAGSATTQLASTGAVSDISPPIIVAGQGINFIISTVETITILLDTSVGEIEVNIGLEM